MSIQERCDKAEHTSRDRCHSFNRLSQLPRCAQQASIDPLSDTIETSSLLQSAALGQSRLGRIPHQEVAALPTSP